MISTSWHLILTTPPCVFSLSGHKPSCSVPGRFLDGSHWQVIGNPSVSISKLFPRLPLPVRSGILVRLCHDWSLRNSHYNYLCVPLIPGRRRQWHPTPVLLPGKSHGWRSLEGCSPCGCWGSDTTERLHFDFSLSCIGEGYGNPLQCSCLENPRDGEAWWAAVYGVAQSRTQLKWRSSSSSSNPRWLSDKESTCQCRRLRFDPWVGKIPWRRKWQPTSVFLPGKSHGERNLVGYSPWAHKKSDTIEGLSTHTISFTEKRKNSSLKWRWGSYWHQQIVKKIQ